MKTIIECENTLRCISASCQTARAKGLASSPSISMQHEACWRTGGPLAEFISDLGPAPAIAKRRLGLQF